MASATPAAAQDADGPRGTERPCADVEPADFDDAIPDAHRDAVRCAAGRQLLAGFGDGTFGANLRINRGQMASFLVGYVEDALGDELPAGSSGFSDIAASTHRDAIGKLADADIAAGVGEGRYAPQGFVTRAQMATFLARALDYLDDGEVNGSQPPAGTATTFSDVDGSGVHDAAIAGLVDLGVIAGVTTELFQPNGDVTRGQTASFMMRSYDYFLAEIRKDEEESDGADEPDEGDSDDDGDDDQADDPPPTGGGGSTPPADGPNLRAVTDRPELTGVSVRGDGDPAATVIRYTFDENVTGNVTATLDTPGSFRLYTFDAVRAEADSVEVSGNHVDATFGLAGGVDLDLVTTATVAAGAVTKLDEDLTNPEGVRGLRNVDLDGQTGTAAPDLIDVAFDDGAMDTTITLTFDEGANVDFLSVDTNDDLEGDALYLVPRDGDEPLVDLADLDTTVAAPDEDPNAGETTVEVTVADEVLEANDYARLVIAAGTVEKQGGAGNPLQKVDLRAGSDLPDLTNVSFDAGTERATFTFDEPIRFNDTAQTGAGRITDVVIDGLSIYGLDGLEEAPSAAFIPSDRADRIVAQYDVPSNFTFLGASVGVDTVIERSGLRRVAGPDEYRTSGTDATTVPAGTTVAPDLDRVFTPQVSSTDINGDADEYTVRFVFDDDVASFSGAAGFRLWVADERDPIEMAACDLEDGEVHCAIAAADAGFDDVEDAVLATVAADTVERDHGMGDDAPEGAAVIG